MRLTQALPRQIGARLIKANKYRVIATAMPGPCVGPQHTRRLGQMLDVRFLVDGRIEIQDKLWCADLRVLSSETGEIIWAQRFEVEPRDIRSDIDHLSRVITGNILGIYTALVGPGHGPAEDQSLPSRDARDHVIRGYYFYHQRTRAANDRAIGHFHEATVHYPNDYNPHQALAFGLVEAVRYGWTERPEALLRQAHAFAQRAFELDQTAYEAHWALGFTHLLRRDYDSAGAAFESALRLSPDVPHLIADLGELYLYAGRPDVSIARIREAQSLNQSAPFYYADTLARAQADLGDFEGALASYRAMGPAADRFVLIGQPCWCTAAARMRRFVC